MSSSLKVVSIAVLSVLLVSGIFGLGTAGTRVYAASHSHSINVAYVSESTTWPAAYEGGTNNVQDGLFGWAVSTPCTGTTSTCTMTTTGGNTVTFTYIDVSTIDSGGYSVISPYDTVVLYEVCDIGSAANANLMSAINTFLSNGGKVVIYDADWCAAGDGGSPVYSTFLFPFTSSNPGPAGSVQTPTFIETESSPAVLTRGLASISTSSTDAIGDSNTFVTNNPAWCAAE